MRTRKNCEYRFIFYDTGGNRMLNANYLLIILGVDFRVTPFFVYIILASLVMFWQLFWLAVIPFSLIKAVMMQKYFTQETFKKLLLINAVSNGFSIWVGDTIAFAILFNTFGILLNALITYRYYWSLVLIATGLFLFPYAYFVSVWIERWVVAKFLGKKYEQEVISQAVKTTNKTSYTLLFVAYVLFAVVQGAYLIYMRQ